MNKYSRIVISGLVAIPGTLLLLVGTFYLHLNIYIEKFTLTEILSEDIIYTLTSN